MKIKKGAIIMDLRVTLVNSNTTIYLNYNSDTNTIIEKCTSRYSTHRLYKVCTHNTDLNDLDKRVYTYINDMHYRLVDVYDYNEL